MSAPAEQRGVVERTVAQALREATAALAAAGIERARVEAEILLAHVLRARRIDLVASPERVLTGQEAEAFDRLVARRATRYPLPYLTGEREFMGLRFHVNEHVLIPRPETEVMVEAAIEALRGWVAAEGECSQDPELGAPVAIDVGTGSGCIAISLAHFVPQARVLATDISPEACAVARLNAARLGVASRVTVYAGDLLEPLEEVTGAKVPLARRAAVVCANLPYIPEENLGKLQPEVRDWEPAIALGGGPGGLHVVERFLEQVQSHLRAGGTLFLEIGPEADQAPRLTAALGARGRWRDVRVLRDLAGWPRVVAAIYAA
ncbi:MAG TPA: peptide chain release factor N(5)-glutamine methyltransferase [Armatimonadota bacterium]|nr:peptide chain release factor N(5)-glutamine methyltransferase [Armatimonadota bacterium]HOM82810.1 peptide chain release factor N(5)-glutamine methyltransferase [Armatimonadota bacterium]